MGSSVSKTIIIVFEAGDKDSFFRKETTCCEYLLIFLQMDRNFTLMVKWWNVAVEPAGFTA